LSDPNKREVYDRYGIDGMKRHDRRSSDGGDGHNGGAASFTGGFYGAEELTPEDIFNLFFSAQGLF
jgi:DnaJ family protein B protein 4